MRRTNPSLICIRASTFGRSSDPRRSRRRLPSGALSKRLCSGGALRVKGRELMADAIRYVTPRNIEPNEENPRLIFHADELQSLQDSIRDQGILVPLTVFTGKRAGTFVLL